MKIRLNIIFKLILLLGIAIDQRLALAELKSNNSSDRCSTTNIERRLTGGNLNSLSVLVSNMTDVVAGGLLNDGETLLVKGMRVEVEKMAFCIPSAAGGLAPLDRNLVGRQYLLRFPEAGGVVFLWTEFDSACGAQKFADLTCTFSSTMPAFMVWQKLCVNRSGLGDFQVELRDGGSVFLFVRGGIVVDVRNKDIEIAKALDELILVRTKEHLKGKAAEHARDL